MSSDTFSLLFGSVLLLFLIIGFVWISIKVRKHGGSMTTTMHAATYEFLSKDNRAAIGQIVEVKANKKMEEESGKVNWLNFPKKRKPIKDIFLMGFLIL